MPADSGRYRVTVTKKGKPLAVHVRGDMKVNDLALDMTRGTHRAPPWAVGQGASYLWHAGNDEDDPVPRARHLGGLKSLWIKLGATRCSLRVDASAAE